MSNELPTLERKAKATTKRETAAAPAVTAEKERRQEMSFAIETRAIEVPIATGLPYLGYVPKRVDVHLTDRERSSLTGLLEGLRQQEATIRGGQPVQNRGDAIRWLLEQVGGAA